MVARMEDEMSEETNIFGLSRAAYLVLPRMCIREMPADWQKRLNALMDEAAGLEVFPDHNYQVTAVGSKGRFYRDPYGEYRHKDTSWAKSEIEARAMLLEREKGGE